MTLQDRLEERLCREIEKKESEDRNVTLLFKKYMDLIRKADKRENKNIPL